MLQAIKSIIYSDPEIRKGEYCFRGTRIPVYYIVEHVADGWSIRELNETFPDIKISYLKRLFLAFSEEFRKQVDNGQT